jgi:Rhodopirellula transposase DDE domain
MDVSDETKQVYIETAKALKGSERRLFMARVVNSLGVGGQRRAAEAFGWTRATIRQGQHELASGMVCLPGYAGRGRKRAEERLPHLLDDIKAIVDGQSQTDARFESSRLYTRLSAAQVRQPLIDQKGYSATEIPSQETIRVKLNELGYRLRTVQKSVPQKR